MGPVVLGMRVFLPAKERPKKATPNSEGKLKHSLPALGVGRVTSHRGVAEHPSPQCMDPGCDMLDKVGNSE